MHLCRDTGGRARAGRAIRFGRYGNPLLIKGIGPPTSYTSTFDHSHYDSTSGQQANSSRKATDQALVYIARDRGTKWREEAMRQSRCLRQRSVKLGADDKRLPLGPATLAVKRPPRSNKALRAGSEYQTRHHGGKSSQARSYAKRAMTLASGRGKWRTTSARRSKLRKQRALQTSYVQSQEQPPTDKIVSLNVQ